MFWKEIKRELRKLLKSSSKKRNKQKEFDKLILKLKKSPELQHNIDNFDRRFINQLLEPLRPQKEKFKVPYSPLVKIGKEGGKILDTGGFKAVKSDDKSCYGSEKKNPKYGKSKRKYAVKFKRFLKNSPIIREVKDNSAYYNKRYFILSPKDVKKEDKDLIIEKTQLKPSNNGKTGGNSCNWLYTAYPDENGKIGDKVEDYTDKYIKSKKKPYNCSDCWKSFDKESKALKHRIKEGHTVEGVNL